MVLHSPHLMIPLPFPKAKALIRTPTQSQFIAVKASLTRKERAATTLDDEVTNLKNRLAVLSKERRLLNEAVKPRDSPITKLPPEVLQEIFVLCLPVAYNAVMSAREAPLLLCRVCHDWRQLAHATPRLWTSIHISLCYDVTIVPIPSPDDVISWLSRSKSLPLSLSLYGCPSSYNTGVIQFKPYLDILSSVVSRCSSIHLSTTSDMLDYIFSADAVPVSLEELYIDSISWFNMNIEETVFSNSGGALLPKLHSLSLPFDALILFRRNTEHKRLTHLAISRPDYGTYELGEIVDVLHSVPFLRSLSISGFHAHEESSSFSHLTIHLSDLESLSITDYRPYAHVWGFLVALHTPLLRHWKYHLLPSHDSHPIKGHLNAIHSFLSRLKEPLEELDLHIHSYGTEFRRFLSFLPGLKRLSLHRHRASGPFWFGSQGIRNIGDFHLKCLSEDSDIDWEGDSNYSPNMGDDAEVVPVPASNFHCPQLEVIKCVCLGLALSEDVLLDFLRLRTGSGAKAAEIASLKKVDILTESAISDELREKVCQILDGTGTLFHLRSSPLIPTPGISYESIYPAYHPTF